MNHTSLIILKTTKQHFIGVTEHQKHALRGRMTKAHQGDVLIIAEIQDNGPAVAKYAMQFKQQYADHVGQSEVIWGKRWRFIVDGEKGCWLSKPFAPAALKPDGPYAQGGTLVYVPTADAIDFIAAGHLSPIL
ncbi:hypothetical protein [Mesorhizobium sp. J8]|uniref:hypothetical protein n=1 Tax=Mesorhizobium sp. J8 TaxID=2777475 RepID=UPI0019160724|nr:hypothetical protein [Mesorhizobium sp. J8]BCM16352.1 hypothetical protein MJ8_01100 [Mesorhizobium sp. J8]